MMAVCMPKRLRDCLTSAGLPQCVRQPLRTRRPGSHRAMGHPGAAFTIASGQDSLFGEDFRLGEEYRKVEALGANLRAIFGRRHPGILSHPYIRYPPHGDVRPHPGHGIHGSFSSIFWTTPFLCSHQVPQRSCHRIMG